MKRAFVLPVLALLATSSVRAAEVHVVATYDMPGRVPVSLFWVDGLPFVFDPMAGVIAEVPGGLVAPVPSGAEWSKIVSSGNGVLTALDRDGRVDRWVPATDEFASWDVTGVIDLAFGCNAVWLLFGDGRVERRDPGVGTLQNSWTAHRPSVAKIQVSDALEQVVLAPIQGSEVYLHDTGGVHLRTISGPAAARCADAALGPGGVLAVADRFNSTIELYGPLGDHIAGIAPRGQGEGEVMRPASLTWQGDELWTLDPGLGRITIYKVGPLDEWVMPMPLAVSPAGGTRAEPDRIEFVVVSHSLSIRPDMVQVELQHDDGTDVAHVDLPVDASPDTLRWTPEVELEAGASYRWRTRAVGGDFSSGWSAWSAFSTAGLPETFELLPNYPNPFNASTVIALAVPDAGDRHISVEIFNTLGRRVRTLFDGTPEPGALSVIWDGRDDRGVTLGSGVYFVRMVHSEGLLTRKAVMVK